MKRKLEETQENGGQEGEAPAQEKPARPSEPSFTDFGLDTRLLAAIADQGFHKPTTVQARAIPLVLDGRDVVARSKTGSGKTAAYVLPVLQRVLEHSDSPNATRALILVPTRELAEQVFKEVGRFSAYCAKDVHVVKLDKESDAVSRSLLANSPDIVISTPARALHNAKSSALSLNAIKHLVLDEADLLMSYGYRDDLESLAQALPKGIQTILTTATFNDVQLVESLFLREPVQLDLHEPEAETNLVTQYVVKCGEDDKFLFAYLMFKLKLIKGKCIIFVADTDRSYRLKLFFEQFGIRSCILNSELPVNTRIHTVEQFNSSVYSTIIASDEHEVLGDEEEEAQGGEASQPNEKATGASTEAVNQQTKESGDRPKTKKRKKWDKEYGISRGIDFKMVSAVLNFDMPLSSTSYQHRIGRTARAGQSGMAISFCIPKELFRKHMPTSIPSCENDEKILARITKQQAKRGLEIKDYAFDMKQADAFRYRMNDALRAVTKVAVREARTRELKQELLQSQRLARYFEENPAELRHLRHDTELHHRKQAHLQHVPDYLLPKDGKKAFTAADSVGFVPMNKERRKPADSKRGGKFKGGRGRKTNPLSTFKLRRKGK